jgi:UDP-N-acetylmuramate--alanine ligase
LHPLEGRRIWFAGIGGAGLSSYAVLSHAWGADVAGWDRVETPYLTYVRAVGIPVTIAADPPEPPEAFEVVVSSAFTGRVEGKSRAEFLADLVSLHRSIVVAGAHGKTTTAAMIAFCLDRLGHDPAYLLGGEVPQLGGNARAGEGWLVVEGDESDRTVAALRPEIAVLTNVELDHHATYASLGELEEAFAEFAEPAELLILGPGVELDGRGREVRFDVRGRVELLPGGSRFDVQGTEVELRVPGRHNILNALAALAACRAAGVEPDEAAPALATFTGAARRFESHGRTASGARIFDDYAHHPTEVRATLEAARTLAAGGKGRIVACFQPHLYSRTRLLARDFGRALALSDLVVVLDVYPARERAEDFPGVSGLLVAQAAADAAGGRPVWWLPAMEDAERMLAAELGEDDILLTMGAGDVDRLARGLAA